jgi:hypothetical protein
MPTGEGKEWPPQFPYTVTQLRDRRPFNFTYQKKKKKKRRPFNFNIQTHIIEEGRKE